MFFFDGPIQFLVWEAVANYEKLAPGLLQRMNVASVQRPENDLTNAE
jgi:hypothetical protein